MKKVFLNILSISFILTTFGMIIDGDVVKTTMLVRFSEFFLMWVIISLMAAAFYFPINYFLRRKAV